MTFQSRRPKNPSMSVHSYSLSRRIQWQISQTQNSAESWWSATMDSKREGRKSKQKTTESQPWKPKNSRIDARQQFHRSPTLSQQKISSGNSAIHLDQPTWHSASKPSWQAFRHQQSSWLVIISYSSKPIRLPNSRLVSKVLYKHID